jgi:CubicO group peptidase (beta-lactamase class C family)
MVRVLGIVLAALVVGALCAGVVFAGAVEGWWRQPLAPHGNAASFAAAAVKKLTAESNGNAAFLQMTRWSVTAENYRSIGKPVDRETQFQVASLSKWVTAIGVMTLAERGKIDLEAPVSRYLKRWSLPKSAFNLDGVTVRRLLSHTAGLTDGLGYAGFKPGEAIQSLPASLTRAADASPGKDGAVHVGAEPGAGFDYSGGGYTLMQLMIEDVTGLSFDGFMREAVFAPLQMRRSSFAAAADASNLAEFFDENGKIAPHYRFTALAAASLYTSVGDLARLVAAHRGPAPGFLPASALRQMRRPEASQFGAPIWGLGTMLYAPNASGDFIIGHDGSNEPAINTTVRFDPDSGDGIIILETGNKLLATEIGGEWVYWRTGNVDFLTIFREFPQTLLTMALAGGGGLVLMLLLALTLGRRKSALSRPF